MKIRITFGLCAVLGVGFLPVHAADNPAQAAARAALEQKLSRTDAWEPQPLTVFTNLPSIAVAEPASKVAGVAGLVSAQAAAPQAAPAPITPAVAAAPAAPAVTASALVAPVMSPLVVSFLILSLLVVSGLLLKVRQLKLKLRQFDSRI
jgi:pyruvate dehydrogenase E2 component (dihydrolipoamide acetyltransferase)